MATCFYCGKQMCAWEHVKNPLKEHLTYSPDCDPQNLVKQLDTGKITPIKPKAHSPDLFSGYREQPTYSDSDDDFPTASY